MPWKTAYGSKDLIGKDVRFVLAASGHVAGVINPPARNKRSHWLNDELAGREFLANDQFSMADIVTLTTVDFATWIGLPTPAELTNLHAWHARVSARPSAGA